MEARTLLKAKTLPPPPNEWLEWGVILHRRLQCADEAADACELRHRRKLLILLLLRPAARAGTRAALAGLAGAATSPSLRGWCASALELVEGLEHSVAFRYFR